MKNIVILISGGGSNMAAIVKAAQTQNWKSQFSAQIAAVISNKADAAGLAYAKEQSIPSLFIDHKAYASREAFEADLMQQIDTYQPALLVLAGFMRILGTAFVQRYEGRLLNIHPSLLPAFPGLHTHRRALEAGCQLVGATVHFVTPELDHGPIVMQSAVPVLAGDDEAALSARVLATEHVIYPLSVRWFVEGKLRVEQGRVRQVDGASQVLM